MSNLHTQNLVLSSGKLDHEEAYWLRKLDGAAAMSTFPATHARTPLAQGRTMSASRAFSAPVQEAVMKAANGSPAAVYMVVAAGVASLLSIYNEAEDILIGMPVFQQAKQANALNKLLALRTGVHPESDTFRDVLMRVKDTIQGAVKHANYPYERLMRQLGLYTGDGVMPLCNTIVLLEQLHGSRAVDATDADMVFAFSLDGGGLCLTLSYNAALYAETAAERIVLHLEGFLASALADPKATLSTLSYLPEAEQSLLLDAYNASERAYAKDRSLARWFEEQVEKTPDRIAVVFEEKRLTYRELNEKANQLAWLLLEKGVQKNQVIGLMVERSLELVIAVWAVLKAGAAYVPIDPDYPEARIRYMLEHSQTELLITQAKFESSVSDLAGETLFIEETMARIATPTANPNVAYDPDQLMYLLYTSGSTGNPKGAMIKCHSFVNLLTWYVEEFGMGEDDCVLLMAPISFDTAQKNLFCTLLVGGRLAVYSPGLYDYHQMSDLIEREGVTIVNCTPNAFYPFVDFNADSGFKRLAGLKKVFLGGEPIALSRCKPWLLANNFQGEIINTYGPTECTDLAAFYRIDNRTVSELSVVPIGKPLYNAKLYVLDKHLRLLPVGMTGELYIGGAGVSKGYFRAEELTKERFLPTPHLPSNVVYKTGDLVRWLPDGNMEFVGRVDHQVKIRGYRIELGEIESKLLQHEAIQDVLVTDRADATGKFLCAYLKTSEPVRADALRAALAAQLPDFMVPSHFVFLDKFPLTPSGKIDRKALPDPKQAREERTYLLPVNKTEAQLAAIWQEVLGYETVSTDAAFSDLGGHSLQAIDVVARIYQQFHLNVTLRDIYTLQTIQAIALHMQQLNPVEQQQHAITPAAKKPYYPASSAQLRMYVIQETEGAQTTYNMTEAMLLKGVLDKPRLLRAIERLVERHETLRTSFAMIDGQVVQRIHDEALPDVRFATISESHVQEAMQAFVRPFDLQSPSLFRAGVLEVNPEQHVLLVDLHHSVADGVSMRILMEDLMDLYQEKELTPLALQYKDFSEWQHRFFKSDAFAKQEQFWLDLFEGDVPMLDLPTDKPRAKAFQNEGAQLFFAADRDLTQRIRGFVREQKTTLNTVLLAAYSVFLARHANQEDVVIGLPILGKPHAELERTAGMFVNTLAVRNRPAFAKRFDEYLDEVKQTALQCFANQDYPLELLVEKLGVMRDNSRHPLFDTMLVVQNIDMPAFALGSVTAEPLSLAGNTAKFDLTLSVEENREELAFSFEYATALFRPETMEVFAQRFLMLLQAMVENPASVIGSFDLVLPDEKRLLLTDFQGKERVRPEGITVTHVFEDIAAQQPDHISLIHGDAKLTYRELNEKANQLARFLREKGVRTGQFVGILTERSIDLFVCILGVLKAGGAYVPIDPDYPQDRIAYMLEQSQAALLLTQAHLLDTVAFAGETLAVNDLPCFANGDRTNLPSVHGPTDLAYLIYTSGTTGRPKGVMIEHKGWLNVQAYVKEELGLTPQDRVVEFFSQSFDASVMEINMSLLCGGALVVASKETVRDTIAFAKLLQREQVTAMTLTPAYAALLDPAQLPHMRMLLGGGSASSAELVRKWSDHLDYVNVYGPTEGTIVASTIRYRKGAAVPHGISIGTPLHNTRLYVLSANAQLQPVGVAGELCIAGTGVARGYYQRPDLTDKQFSDDPFLPGAKMYRTGDLVRWLPNGTLEYLGRIDQQVKIRGYRIELGEVESCLLAHPDIREAHVSVYADEHQQNVLCAYFTTDRTLSAQELRAHLGQRLPHFMIPSRFLQLDAFPLTNNGKVDAKALPDPKLAGEEEAHRAPSNETEAQLVAIWQDALGLETVSTDIAFSDLGGHSLQAIDVAARISKQFHVNVTLRDIYTLQTIQAIALHMQQSNQAEPLHAIAPAAKQPYYPASSAQLRMYVMQQMGEGTHTTYNITEAMLLKGALDKPRLLRAIERLVERHETLRTSFDMIDGQVMQRIHDDVVPDVAFASLSETHVQEAIQAFVRPFDLQSPSLFRAGVLEVNPEQHVLLFDLHHSVADGVSMRILMEDLMELYQEKELAPLPLQYKDFSEWQHRFFTTDAFARQEQFWLDLFEGDVPMLDLPTDSPRAQVYQNEGAYAVFKADRELTQLIRDFVRERKTTLNTVLLAAYSVFLARHANQEDVVIGLPILGKPHNELERTAGMFVNTLAVRNRPAFAKRFDEYLEEVKQTSLQCFANQDYPFELLVEKLNVTRDNSRHPLFDTMLAVHNIDMPAFAQESVTAEPISLSGNTAKFDLTLSVQENREELEFTFEYATALFRQETIQAFAQRFLMLLQAIVANPKLTIGSFDLVLPNEKRLLLTEFNRTERAIPDGLTATCLFEDIANRQPDHIALIHGEAKLTYRELNEKANQLAHYLREKGVRPGRFVGILTERSIDLYISILAVLKAGGAYVPIDPDYPQDRIAYMLEHSQASLLLTQAHLLDAVAFAGEKLDVNDLPCFANGERGNLPGLHAPSDLAYLIYTSGTTGRPKGVMIEHKSWVNVQAYVKEELGLTPQDRIGQFFSQSFDGSVLEVTMSLLVGGTLVVASSETVRDANAFAEQLQREQVTAMIVTPAYAALLNPAQLPHLRMLLVGGSASSAELVRRWTAHLDYVNAYGPTEGTIIASTIRYRKGEELPGPVSIGTPLFNTQLHVVGANMHLQAVGAAGELCIAGTGVARGYYNQPELTAKQFVDNPFHLGAKMYRTGDLVRWLPNGTLEYLGRIDQQVKIRGYRIELGEVETGLLAHPDIREAHVAVVQSEDQQQNALSAYFSAGRSLSIQELREHLGKSLPLFMIPSFFVQVEAIPLTNNGKVDQKRLPAPHAQQEASAGQAPETETEKRLAEIWKSELGVEQAGVLDNFFDHGGHSIKAIALLARIKDEFGISLPYSSLLTGGTIRHLALLLEAGAGNQAEQHANPVLLGPTMQHTAQRPLFLVHPIGGNVFCYRALAAELGNEQPVYGLLAQGLADEHSPLDRIEDMAASYIEQMKRVQPHGPYALGGWSFGGAVAYEMAEQLRMQGETIASLLLLDSFAPVAENKPAVSLEAELVQHFLFDLGASASFNLAESAAEIVAASSEEDLLRLTGLASVRNVLQDAWNGEQLVRLYRVYKANLEALRRYEAPARTNHPITLIVADRSAEGREGLLGWEQLALNPVTAYAVTADHYSLLAEPAVQHVVSLIKADTL